MTYIVNDKCIMCKHTDCVEVCPVDCFYEGENMLVINPDECIDCGVCEPECPVDAIEPDTNEGTQKWVEFNGKWSAQWAVLTEKKINGKDFLQLIQVFLSASLKISFSKSSNRFNCSSVSLSMSFLPCNHYLKDILTSMSVLFLS